MSEWLVEFPLWGLQVPGLTSGITNLVTTCGGFIYQPTWAEWEQSEKTDVVRENAGNHLALEQLGQKVYVHPPPCFALQAEIDPYPDLDSEGDYLVPALAFVSALRLHKKGQFFDFTQSGIYGQTEDGMMARSVTPFRSAYYQYPWSDRYQLLLEELHDIEKLHEALIEFEDVNLHIALENLRLSFGVAVPPEEIALLRFMALETLMGGPGSSVKGVRLATRVARGFGHNWVEDWLEGPGRLLRNRVAHSTDRPDSIDEADLERLDQIVRHLIIQFLQFIRDGKISEQPLREFNRFLAQAPSSDGG